MMIKRTAVVLAMLAGLTGCETLDKSEVPTATSTPAVNFSPVNLPAPLPGLPNCPTEDSAGPCNWFGGSNGKGFTYAALPDVWEPVPAGIIEDLSVEPGAPQDWSECRFYVGDTSYVICIEARFVAIS